MIIALLQYLFTSILYFREKVHECTSWKNEWWNPWNWFCAIWNEVVKPVGDAVYSAGDCAKQGMVEIAHNGRCVKYLGKCAEAGSCYVSKAAPAIASCTGGMIVPSEDCRKQNGF